MKTWLKRNDINISAIWENNDKDIVNLIDEAIEWCKEFMN